MISRVDWGAQRAVPNGSAGSAVYMHVGVYLALRFVRVQKRQIKIKKSEQ